MARRFRKKLKKRLYRKNLENKRNNTIKHLKATEKVRVIQNIPYDPSKENKYNQNREKVNNEIKNELTSMMFSNEELMSVYPNTDVIRYIDKDNYNKYLNLKGNFNIFGQYIRS